MFYETLIFGFAIFKVSENRKQIERKEVDGSAHGSQGCFKTYAAGGRPTKHSEIFHYSDRGHPGLRHYATVRMFLL
jgi:hypothetical protein